MMAIIGEVVCLSAAIVALPAFLFWRHARPFQEAPRSSERRRRSGGDPRLRPRRPPVTEAVADAPRRGGRRFRCAWRSASVSPPTSGLPARSAPVVKAHRLVPDDLESAAQEVTSPDSRPEQPELAQPDAALPVPPLHERVQQGAYRAHEGTEGPAHRRQEPTRRARRARQRGHLLHAGGKRRQRAPEPPDVRRHRRGRRSPRGRRTRLISASRAARSRTCSSTFEEKTTSKLASGNGIWRPSYAVIGNAWCSR